MKFPKHHIKFATASALTHIRNNLSLYLPNIVSAKPQRIIVMPTLKCNLQCKHCYVPHDCEELSTGKWLNTIERLRAWLGPFNMHISGAEPFMRDDLLKLICYAHSRNVFTSVFTNGTLINERIAEKIIKSGLDRLFVSLDGLEQTHDFLRGTGVYKEVTQFRKFDNQST